MAKIYYNDFDPNCKQWLANLVVAGLIPAGDVDGRSITDVKASDLAAYTQCHFFYGIGGWPRALQLASYPIDQHIWTASLPCQPFSTAGKRKGAKDERHLWPVFRELVKECRPATLFGEQVASKAGRAWLAGVRADLEGLGYAVGAADLCAASAGETGYQVSFGWEGEDEGEVRWDEAVPCIVGAPHIRQRLFWGAVRLADAECDDRWADKQGWGSQGREVAGRDGEDVDRLANPDSSRSHREGIRLPEREPGQAIPDSAGAGSMRRSDCGTDHWSRWVGIPCADGKTRRVPQSVLQCLADGLLPSLDHLRPEEGFPLAQGVEGRPTKLRGIGNSINPQLAAMFIEEFVGAVQDLVQDKGTADG